MPSLPPAEAEQIQFLWNELLKINQILSKSEDELKAPDIGSFETRAREWVKKFTDIHHTRNVTPYIHAVANHVSEFMKLHGSIISFTQQGLEKYNDCMTKQYFRATSHRGEEALRQIMEKRNHLDYYGNVKNASIQDVLTATRLVIRDLLAKNHAVTVTLLPTKHIWLL